MLNNLLRFSFHRQIILNPNSKQKFNKSPTKWKGKCLIAEYSGDLDSNLFVGSLQKNNKNEMKFEKV